MTDLVESLHRLYSEKRVSLEQLKKMNTDGTLTNEELSYVIATPVDELDMYKSYYKTTQAILPQEAVSE